MKLTSDFVFEGFSKLMKQPMLFLYWGAIGLVYNLTLFASMILVGGPAFMKVQSMQTETNPDPEAALQAMSGLMPMYGIMMVLGLLFAAVIQCAVYRMVIKPDDKGFGYLKIGMDEVRQIIVSFAMGIIFIGVYIAMILPMAIIIGIGIGVVKGVIGGIITFVAVVAAIVGLFYIFTRLSLAGPQSFAEQKINLFGSFGLTKGQGWSLFGGYVLLFIVLIVLMIAFFAIIYGVMLMIPGAGHDFLNDLMQPDLSSLNVLLKPSKIAQLLMGGLMAAPMYALMYGSAAAAYRILSQKEATPQSFG